MTTYKFDIAAIVTIDIEANDETTARMAVNGLQQIDNGPEWGEVVPGGYEVTCIAPRDRAYLVEADGEGGGEEIPQPISENARRSLRDALDEAVAALEGDSNDAEHDALYIAGGTIAGVLGAEFNPRDPYDDEEEDVCGCGGAIVKQDGEWMHVRNPELTGADDHDAEPG